MIFVSNRLVENVNRGQDLWVSHRKDKRDDFGWETPVNLGATINSPMNENGPCLFNDEATGQTLLYYSSARGGGLGGLDIYVSLIVLDKDGIIVGQPSPVAGLNTNAQDYQPTLSKDGLEIIFASGRPGGSGYVDLWYSTRPSTLDPWLPPQNLGPTVNSTAYDFHPTLSWDGTTLIFASERAGGAGWGDLYISTRTKLKGPK
jgi:Tol biopolymer transport system component